MGNILEIIKSVVFLHIVRININTYVCSFILLLCLNISAQEFNWAKRIGGSTPEFASSVIVDVTGNVYTTGRFASIVDFDPGSGNHYMSSSGTYDAFVSKLDPNGNFIWAKKMGGIDDVDPRAMIIDASGYIYITGTFFDRVNFNPSGSAVNLTSVGQADIFIVKLDTSGRLIWAKQMGGFSSDFVNSIAVDNSGNVYTTGWFQGGANFNPGGVHNLTSVGGWDIFISKLDSDGNFVWVKQIGGTLNEYGTAIAVDASGNVYTSGHFQGTADFDPGAGIYNLTSANEHDLFVSKLDTDGNFIWAKKMGGQGNNLMHALSLDAARNVYTTGRFEATVDFNPGTGTYNLISAGSSDIFVSKLDTDGNFVWAGKMGGNSIDIGKSIFIDANQDLFITGEFQGTADFDPGAGTYHLTSAGNFDKFIVKLNSAGLFNWAVRMGGGSNISSNSIFVDENNSIYTTGQFQGTADFNPGTSNHNLTSGGSWDVFISKLNSCIDSFKFDVTICYGKGYTVGDNEYFDAGIYYDKLKQSNGCDSIVVTTLTVSPPPETLLNITICKSKSYKVGSKEYFNSGFYTDTLKTSEGCDSIVKLSLTVTPPPKTELSIGLCEGQTYFVGQKEYTVSGNYLDTLSTIQGCDSIVELNLSFLEYAESQNDVSICHGESYKVGNSEYFISGNYIDTLTGSTGCDSIVKTTLTVIEPVSTQQNARICEGDSYTFNNKTHFTSGVYSEKFISSTGCDSISSLNLSFYPPIEPEIHIDKPLSQMIAYPEGHSYQWLDCKNDLEPIPGETNQIIYPEDNGEYAVSVTVGECTETSPCSKYIIQHEIILPNAFSPNGDGINDVFSPQIGGWDILSMSIYNKWGEMVYESFSTDAKWDGYFNGTLCQDGVYLVLITYQAMESGNAPRYFEYKRFVLHIIR
jgi:gliding motility-associated-like protein